MKRLHGIAIMMTALSMLMFSACASSDEAKSTQHPDIKSHAATVAPDKMPAKTSQSVTQTTTTTTTPVSSVTTVPETEPVTEASTTEIQLSISTQAAPAAQEESSHEVPAVPEAPAAPHYQIPDGRYANYLFIGDSRTVGMSAYCAGMYIAKSAVNIDWFRQNYDEILSYRNYNIVMLLGVNDLYNINSYIDLYNNLPDDFISANRIILVSVNPCQGSYSHLNDSINNFNYLLENNTSLSYEYIDTNSYLNYIGFETTDGLHYTGQTYTDIYNAILYGF